MNWEIIEGKYQCELGFDSQSKLGEFVHALTKLSDELNHHADMEIRFCTLFISLHSHDVNLITQRDHDWVERAKKLWKYIH